MEVGQVGAVEALLGPAATESAIRERVGQAGFVLSGDGGAEENTASRLTNLSQKPKL